jgi:hypothetical protein
MQAKRMKLMTTMFIPNLLTLPVELLHRIFDDLDANTILLSVRPVCTQLHAIADAYNRYKLDDISISQQILLEMCPGIRPDNVISLKLSNAGQMPDQEDMPFSLDHLRRFTRVRSLTLDEISESNFKIILQYVITSLIISLEIFWTNLLSSDSLLLLSSAIAQPSLRKFDLQMINKDEFEQISCPVQCKLKRLVLTNCTFKQFRHILHHSSHLRSMTISNLQIDTADETLSTSSFPTSYSQLTYLSLYQKKIEMNNIESVLSLTPSLVHLNVSGFEHSFDASLYDGSRWAKLISTKLPRLNKFEFRFSQTCNSEYDMESILAPFRTPFWVEKKRWFVACNYQPSTHNIILRSPPPDYMRWFDYKDESKKISLSTIPMSIDNQTTMDMVLELRFDSANMMPDLTPTKVRKQILCQRTSYRVSNGES